MIAHGMNGITGKRCVFTRTVETRGRGLRTIQNLAGRVVGKIFHAESEFNKKIQEGWIEKENFRTVVVGFLDGQTTAFAKVKKAMVTLS